MFTLAGEVQEGSSWSARPGGGLPAGLVLSVKVDLNGGGALIEGVGVPRAHSSTRVGFDHGWSREFNWFGGVSPLFISGLWGVPMAYRIDGAGCGNCIYFGMVERAFLSN